MKKFFLILLVTLPILGENKMEITSSAFAQNGNIPNKYTCDGQNVSPPLAWKNAPPQAKSFALIMDDPDAPSKTWVHWVVWNLPADTFELPEGVGKGNRIGKAFQGITDFGQNGYGGPCPPSGTHRYFTKLYALDLILDLEPNSNKTTLEKAMKDHILAHAELIGTYIRKRK